MALTFIAGSLVACELVSGVGDLEVAGGAADGGAGASGTGGSAGAGGSAGVDGGAGTGGIPFLAGWSHRSSVLIDNKGSALTDQQVPLSIDAAQLLALGRLLDNANDLRITTEDNQVLSHWIETDLVADTRVWVKLSSLDAGQTRLFVYSGNPTAANIASGDAVFPFFDDFDGSVLDSAKWAVTLVSGTAGHAVTGGELRLHASGGSPNFPHDSVQIVAAPYDGDAVIATRLEVLASGDPSHAEIVWRSSPTQHWFQNGRWALARYRHIATGPENIFEISDDVGLLKSAESLGSPSMKPTRFQLLRQAPMFDVLLDDQLMASFDSGPLGWSAQDTTRPCLSAGNNSPFPGYDFRFAWFYLAKPLPANVALSYGPIESAP